MRKPKIYKTDYEEIQNKKLENFYVILHVVKIKIPVKKNKEIYEAEITVIYGVNLQGIKTIIGIYEEDKNNSRYWLEQIEYIKSRNLEKIKFVSTETNKRLEQALKIVYTGVEIIPSADKIISKIVNYAPNRWRDETGREILKLFLANDIEDYKIVLEDLKEKYSDNKIVLIILKKNEKEIESYYKYSREFRHLFCSYYTIRVMLYTFLNSIRNKEEYYTSLKELINDSLCDYLSKFESNRSYKKKDWIKIQNEIYDKFAEEIEVYIL